MEKQSKPKDQDEKLDKICREIEKRTQYIKKNSWFDRFMTKTHQANYHYSRGEGVVAKYQVTDACKGCGTCEKVCPTNNIHVSDGRAVFGNDCLSCLACTQNCPVNAIRLAGEKSMTRYRNPEVQLFEIMEANK